MENKILLEYEITLLQLVKELEKRGNSWIEGVGDGRVKIVEDDR